MNFGVVADERRCPRRMHSSTGQEVNTLFGVEVNITSKAEGSDYPRRYGPKLDLISGGFHRESAGDLYRGMSAEHNTAALQDYLQHCPLDVLTHPCTRAFPLVIKKVVELALQYGFALEVNNTNLVVGKTDTDRLEKMLKLARDAGAAVVECSDGHTFVEIGENAAIKGFLATHGLDGDEMLLNRNEEKLASFLKDRKARRSSGAARPIP